MEELSKRKFNFLAWLTALVVLGYVAGSVIALYNGAVDFKDFSAAIGPIAGLLLGWWSKDKGE